MELKPIFNERADEAGLELPRDYFLGVALEVLDSRFGHADRPIVNRRKPPNPPLAALATPLSGGRQSGYLFHESRRVVARLKALSLMSRTK